MQEYIQGLKNYVLVIIFTVATASVNGAENSELFTLELSNPTEPATLVLQSWNDQITVIAEERTNLEFEIEPRNSDLMNSGLVFDLDGSILNQDTNVNSSITRDHSGLTRIEKNPGYVVDELNNVINFSSTDKVILGFGSHIRVRVPIATSLRLKTAHELGISIAGVNGTHELSSGNGPIEATSVSGSIVAEAINGDVIVSMNQVDQENLMAFTAGNGNIDLTFPSQYSADAYINPGSGLIYTDFQFDTDQSNELGAGNNGNQSFEIGGVNRYKLNGGGASLRVQTLVGNIYIRQAN